MARIINGQPADNSEEKKKAVESSGGSYNRVVKGNYIQSVQGTGNTVVSGDNKVVSDNQSKQNYVENLEGDHIVDGEKTGKKKGWF